jgi:hypothetical protein
MQTLAMNGATGDEAAGKKAARARLNHLAWLLDNSIRLPGTDFRIGLDAVLGLLPVAGDTLGVLASGFIVFEAARLGVPAGILFRMALNVAIEGLVGAIPFAGDIFDAAWKANQRNVDLLNQYLDSPDKAAATTRVYVFLVLMLMVLVALAISMIAFLMVNWVWSALATPIA